MWSRSLYLSSPRVHGTEVTWMEEANMATKKDYAFTSPCHVPHGNIMMMIRSMTLKTSPWRCIAAASIGNGRLSFCIRPFVFSDLLNNGCIAFGVIWYAIFLLFRWIWHLGLIIGMFFWEESMNDVRWVTLFAKRPVSHCSDYRCSPNG